jgi:hypothetical protein
MRYRRRPIYAPPGSKYAPCHAGKRVLTEAGAAFRRGPSYSILKGFPIGTFIFWKTKEELRSYKEVGNHKLPETPKGDYAQYIHVYVNSGSKH